MSKLQADWKSNVRYTSLLPGSLALNRTLLHDFLRSKSIIMYDVNNSEQICILVPSC